VGNDEGKCFIGGRDVDVDGEAPFGGLYAGVIG